MGIQLQGRVVALCASVSMGLAACGGGGSSPPLAPTVTLTTAANAVEHGQSTALTWQSSNATACSGLESGMLTAPAASATSGGGQTAPITRDTTFALTCTGPGGSTSASVIVQVLPRVTLTATPQPLVDGSPLTLTWAAPGATSCTRSGMSGGWAGPSSTSGSATYQTIIGNGTVLTVSCSSPAGTREASVTIATVRPPPPTVTLQAVPASVSSGGTAQLIWTATNATRCSASGDWSGTRSTSGSEFVGPLTASRSYQLSCENAIGVFASANASVTVLPASASVSGSLTLSASMQTDSDVNDPMMSSVSNNTIAAAQRIPNPATIGGYVNEPNAGPAGASRTAGDEDDLYRVDLVAGQVIELVIGNEDLVANDLDLGLYTTSGVLIDSSMGTQRVERLTALAGGSYLIRVTVYDGASTYTLSIGQRASSAASGVKLSDEFVPGEAIVRRKTRMESLAQREVGAMTLAASHALTRLAGGSDREMLFRLGAETRAQAMSAAAESPSTELRVASREQQAKLETLMALKLLARDPGVASAEPNGILRAMAIPNDPLYVRQAPHYALINMPATWDLTTGSAGIVVAVIDTGVQPHSDLAARLVGGYDFVTESDAGDGDGRDADPRDPGVQQGPGIYSFHGTHVAGTVGAIGNNGVGVSGVAWNTSIMPVRVLGTSGRGTSMAIIQGIRYAARLPNDSGTLPPQRADVINLSLGGVGSCEFAYQQAISDARAAGTIVIAAAGNDNADVPTRPASCAGVVSVSAVGLDRQRASYSNFGAGPSVDVAAPGGDTGADRNGDGFDDGVFSTHSDFIGGTYYGSYKSLNGTSMAAPHVAGIAALMKAVAPSLTPDQFDALLQSGALTRDIGVPGPDSLGVGLIDALKSVRAVASGLPAIPPQLRVNPGALSFGASLANADVVVSNIGSSALTVSANFTSASWINVSAVQVDGSGLGTYRITVNRNALPAGVFSGWVQWESNAGVPVRTTVLVEKATSVLTADAGFQYVLLVRADTFAFVDQVEVRARGASVPFFFAQVPTGNYGLIAGTDLDNDGFICDRGDACAAWPTLSQPEVLVVNGPRTGLELVTSFVSTISAQSQATDAKSVSGQSQGSFRVRRAEAAPTNSR
jgi:serine protease